MNLQQLRAQFRADTDDLVADYLFSDEEIDGWHNEAEEEACRRAGLLEESADPALCEITVTAPTGVYPLHPKLLRVTYAAWLPEGATERRPLGIRSREELDRLRPNWRTEVDEPSIIMLTDTRLRLGCIPSGNGTILLEGTRLPLVAMTGNDDAPEISEAHHRTLIQWALYRAYSKPDAETRDPERAEGALAIFERVFGLRDDADRKRAGEAGPQFNKTYP